MAVHVVTDSTADVSPELERKFGVEGRLHVVPITVHFGSEEYLDGVNLTPPEFYEKLKRTAVMPRTTQPSPGAFVDKYRAISAPGDVVLSYHISNKLSGTYQSALLAARQFPDRQIHVFDTRSASLGVGLVALHAAKMAAAGAAVEEVIARGRALMRGLRIAFVVDTLEYLQRNGRIGKAQAFVGGLLNVKPLLTLEDGVVTPLERVRGRARARARLVERVLREAPPDRIETLAVFHAQALEECEALRTELQARYEGVDILLGELGPTVGTHAGPGVLGVVTLVR